MVPPTTLIGMGTVSLGYSITNVDGSVPQFNILQPLGELADRVVALRMLMSFSWSEPANRAAERPR